MADQAVQTPTLTGPSLTFAACAAGDTFINNGRTFIVVKNTDGSPHDVTIASPTACNQGGTHPVVVTIPATTGIKMIGPFDPTRFNDGTGRVGLSYASLTGMTIAVEST